MPKGFQEDPEERKRRLEWEAEEDLRTLTRAAQIKDDDDRLARAMKLAKKQQKELEQVRNG